ncbi:sigma-54 dependent transcriptional regulator [Geomonas sp.]|uniref:sigma-54-dependent transcriptional regulator n=1 Tax=Geomonas sp. TaxID=2651584 RepID=UPI002B470674|nr:sigma-54 dependent transcriptional regulator [Geomonas sp.]HJV36849.1 sigma-54 dependent transcriptional regulator [Geomonas sp.]
MQNSKASAPAVVIVDDEADILLSYQVMLLGAGFTNIVTCADSRKLLPLLEQTRVGAVILDLQMPHLSGKELLDQVGAQYPQLPVIVVTAANEIATAVACMKAGAFDYQVKPVEISSLVATVKNAMEMNVLRDEISSLRESLLTGRVRNQEAFAGIITQHPKMHALFGYLEAVAATSQPVLISGETGVGKELIARAIHTLSGMSGEFVAINSGGLDDLMFADTLFGHRKGAFTGATDTREGMIAKAAGGTLFLDEIGDLSLASQIKLLRLLQENEYYPLGSDTPLRNRSRIIVATHQRLEQLIEEGSFRKDLYYRLCAHHAEVPPLREREGDLPLLVKAFVEDAARLLNKEKPSCRPELFSYLAGYPFPGNVRELKSMVFDAVARHQGGSLPPSSFLKGMKKVSHLSSPVATVGHRPATSGGRFPTLKEMENHLIEEALQLSNGNQGAAANLLGLTRQALNKRLSRR